MPSKDLTDDHNECDDPDYHDDHDEDEDEKKMKMMKIKLSVGIF